LYEAGGGRRPWSVTAFGETTDSVRHCRWFQPDVQFIYIGIRNGFVKFGTMRAPQGVDGVGTSDRTAPVGYDSKPTKDVP